jgi:uncharacterized protein
VHARRRRRRAGMPHGGSARRDAQGGDRRRPGAIRRDAWRGLAAWDWRRASWSRGKYSSINKVVRDALFPDPEALALICRRHHIRQLSVFGSALRGTARLDSDLDLLVEFEKDAKPGLIGLAGIEIELSSLLNGRKVDLRTAEDLSRHFRDEVLRTAAIQYAA